jgi:hypothetical protein
MIPERLSHFIKKMKRNMVNYSECCGKYVATTKSFKSKNILQTSKLVNNNDYHCSKCKEATTETGKKKLTS